MKILHVGDQAGLGSITANMCSKLGHPSVVTVVKGTRDSWDHGSYYQNVAECKDEDTLVKVIHNLDGDYDHIIYHDYFKLAQELDSLNIPSSYMFHGNQLRQQPTLFDKVNELENIIHTFVTTADLLKFALTATLFERPIDMDLFHSMDIEREDTGLCLTQDRFIQECRSIIDYEQDEVTVVDRVTYQTHYADMPKLLNSVRSYYDIKFQPTHPPYIIPEMSTTGLQALACGTPVWSNQQWFNSFPMQHSDEVTCANFLNMLMIDE
jgi:hypothetical protein